MRERFQAEGGLRFAPADWRAVDALVLEAQDRSGPGIERRLDYRRVRPRLTARPPVAPAELASSRVGPVGDEELDALVAGATALLEEPELRTWWPRPEDVAPWVDELREVRHSPIVVAPAQQEERLRAVLARATAALYPPAITARRLRATAYVLAETGRLDAARRALAVAARLEDRPGHDVPLLQALAQRVLGAHLAAGEAQRREERSSALVMTPDEIRGESRARPPRARA
jgi:hypothetical protein